MPEVLAMELNFSCSDIEPWREALGSYPTRIASLNKPDLVTLDEFYRSQLPSLLRSRLPSPHLTRSELATLMQWKLTRGKFRPRLLGFVNSLDEELVKSASEKAFLALPDLSMAVSVLTVLKGVGPTTASAVLAAYSPDVAPFMSDEAMEAALGNSKEYTLKQYIAFARKLQNKAKELSTEGEPFTASDVERALWSSAVGAKSTRIGREPQIASLPFLLVHLTFQQLHLFTSSIHPQWGTPNLGRLLTMVDNPNRGERVHLGHFLPTIADALNCSPNPQNSDRKLIPRHLAGERGKNAVDSHPDIFLKLGPIRYLSTMFQ